MERQAALATPWSLIDLNETAKNDRFVGLDLNETSGGAALSQSGLTDSVPTIGAPIILPLPIFATGDHVLDYGLSDFTNATAIHVCSMPITQYSDIAVFTLGNYASPAWTGPAAGSPSGRKITSTAVAAGTVTSNGTAIAWAIIDGVNARVMATGPLSAPVALTTGHSFSIDAIAIHYPQ